MERRKRKSKPWEKLVSKYINGAGGQKKTSGMFSQVLIFHPQNQALKMKLLFDVIISLLVTSSVWGLSGLEDQESQSIQENSSALLFLSL